MAASSHDMLKEEVLRFLSGSKTAVLSTLTPEGKPYSSPITYFVDERFRMRFITRETTAKFEHMRREPAVSLVVVEDGPVQRSAQMEGKVELIEEASDDILFRFVDRAWRNPPYLPNFLKLPGYGLYAVTIQIETVRWFYATQHHEDTTLITIPVTSPGRAQARL